MKKKNKHKEYSLFEPLIIVDSKRFSKAIKKSEKWNKKHPNAYNHSFSRIPTDEELKQFFKSFNNSIKEYKTDKKEE